VRGEVERLLNTQADVFDQLEKLETELELSERLLRELRRQNLRVSDEIYRLRRQLDTLRRASVDEAELYEKRVREFYLLREPVGKALPFATSENIQLACTPTVAIAIEREASATWSAGFADRRA